MNRAPLLQSRFRSVYVGLATFWLASSLGIVAIVDGWIRPQIIRSKVESIEALVESHRTALQYHDSRALRDALLDTKIISRDQDFEELRPSIKADFAKVQGLMPNCTLVTDRTCMNGDHVLISSESGLQAFTEASFVVLLTKSTLSDASKILWLKLFLCLSVALILGIVAWAIRQQERFLLTKIEQLIQSFNRVEALFRTKDGAGTVSLVDEFAILSNGVAEMGESLTQKTALIEEYKKQFEQKTRFEQLAKTIAYTSHDLKAPLNEGADFLKNLPEFMESMPSEVLRSSIASLERRLREGAESLQEALQSTKNSQLQSEICLLEFLRDFKRRFSDEHGKSSSSIIMDIKNIAGAKINCKFSDLQTAFGNLFLNSVEAKRDCTIKVVGYIIDDRAIIEFSDDGPGIPEQLIPQIFDEFFTTKSSGSGLGLPIVKRAIANAKGEIEAVSSRTGAKFVISFAVEKFETRQIETHAQMRDEYVQA